MLDFISNIFKPAAKLIDDLHVSDEERGKLQNELAKIQAQMQSKSVELMKAEASLILFTLILLDGFEAIKAPSQVYDLATTFLGVYGGGRSLEKLGKAIGGK